jgi:hypothetical protein
MTFVGVVNATARENPHSGKGTHRAALQHQNFKATFDLRIFAGQNDCGRWATLAVGDDVRGRVSRHVLTLLGFNVMV